MPVCFFSPNFSCKLGRKGLNRSLDIKIDLWELLWGSIQNQRIDFFHHSSTQFSTKQSLFGSGLTHNWVEQGFVCICYKTKILYLSNSLSAREDIYTGMYIHAMPLIWSSDLLISFCLECTEWSQTHQTKRLHTQISTCYFSKSNPKFITA